MGGEAHRRGVTWGDLGWVIGYLLGRLGFPIRTLQLHALTKSALWTLLITLLLTPSTRFACLGCYGPPSVASSRWRVRGVRTRPRIQIHRGSSRFGCRRGRTGNERPTGRRSVGVKTLFSYAGEGLDASKVEKKRVYFFFSNPLRKQEHSSWLKSGHASRKTAATKAKLAGEQEVIPSM